jgi:hypothetical protein
MTDVLHLEARLDTPIACDMRTARDTPEERLGAYGALFGRALLRRERRPGAVVFAFRAAAGVRDTVDDLARREALCCPFLDQRVETAGDEVVWTIAGDRRFGVDDVLDAFHTLPADLTHR